MREVTILFGAPGTGKTTSLIKVVADALKRGVDPERMAYLAFSRKAAKEALDRATEDLGIDKDCFKHFRTIHSAAFRQLELRRVDVMSNQHFKDFGNSAGYVFHGSYSPEAQNMAIDLNGNGDRCLAIYSRAKAKGFTIEQEWRSSNWLELELRTVNQFAHYLDQYKAKHKLVDFTDMLDLCQGALDVDLMIIDEAQDLTRQQWQCARRFGANAESVWIAGDDDQAIYSFSGANPTPLFSIAGNRVVLPHSHRMPIRVKRLADAVANRIRQRVKKQFTPRDEQGYVTWITELTEVDLSSGTWLLLARNRHQLEDLEQLARTKNVVYQYKGYWSNMAKPVRAVLDYELLRSGGTISMDAFRRLQHFVPHSSLHDTAEKVEWSRVNWPFTGKPDWMQSLKLQSTDHEYIRGLRRRGESLIQPGRVIISTVHSAKGGEADNVLLLTDVSRRVVEVAIGNPDDENRVLYVAISRARHALYLVRPMTRNFWTV